MISQLNNSVGKLQERRQSPLKLKLFDWKIKCKNISKPRKKSKIEKLKKKLKIMMEKGNTAEMIDLRSQMYY